MREHLKDHIDLLFRGDKNCEDVKQEILQNTLDRYDDLIAQGKSPEAAYQLAISGIGDVSELLSNRPAQQPAQPAKAPDAVEKPLWKRILFVIAIFLYIVAAIPLIVLSSMGMEAIGLCGTLAIAAVATPLVILSSGSTKKDATQTSNSSSTPRTKFDSICWASGTILYFILSFITGAWHTTWILFCILPCVTALWKNIKNIRGGDSSSIVKVVLWSLLILLLAAILILGLTGNGISLGYSEIGGLPGGTEASSGEADAKSIKNIDIRWVSGKIILRRDNTAQTLTFHEESNGTEKPMAYLISGDTLTIAYYKESTVSFGIHSVPSDKTLIITVPAFWGGSKLRINSVSAEISISDMICEELDLITVSGDVTIQGSGFNSVDIEAVSGDVEYSGAFLRFQGESVSGECAITTSLICEEIDFESVSGDIKLNLPENMGFQLNQDSVSGDLITDIPITTTRKISTYGNGECSISIETVSGDVHIDHTK